MVLWTPISHATRSEGFECSPRWLESKGFPWGPDCGPNLILLGSVLRASIWYIAHFGCVCVYIQIHQCVCIYLYICPYDICICVYIYIYIYIYILRPNALE